MTHTLASNDAASVEALSLEPRSKQCRDLYDFLISGAISHRGIILNHRFVSALEDSEIATDEVNYSFDSQALQDHESIDHESVTCSNERGLMDVRPSYGPVSAPSHPLSTTKK